MTSKNISIAREAYNALRRERRVDESFTDTIFRLTSSRGELSDFFDSWKPAEGEEATIGRELAGGWKKAAEGLSK